MMPGHLEWSTDRENSFEIQTQKCHQHGERMCFSGWNFSLAEETSAGGAPANLCSNQSECAIVRAKNGGARTPAAKCISAGCRDAACGGQRFGLAESGSSFDF